MGMARLGYAIVFVSDMPRSVVFYCDLIGLPLKFESAQWAEFATDGCTLALRKAGPPFGARLGVWQDPVGLPVSV